MISYILDTVAGSDCIYQNEDAHVSCSVNNKSGAGPEQLPKVYGKWSDF